MKTQKQQSLMFVSSTRWTFLLLILIAGNVLADANYNPLLNTQEPVVCSASTTRHFISLDQGTALIRFEDLIPETDYHVFVLPANPDERCSPLAKLPNLKDHARLELVEPGVYLFNTKDSFFEMEINGETCALDQLLSLSIGKVKDVDNTFSTVQGIQISLDEYSVEELIEEVFIGGDCFQVEPGSIQYEGNEESVGFFSSGTDALNMEEGIILSTGRVASAVGPNGKYNTGSWMEGSASDDDLEQLLSDDFNLRDLASLEFDFTPTSEIISFEFVFASEEYCEYVDSDFNDVFGFFISGPGINGPFSDNAENIAFVPGSNDYISINSINHFSNQLFFNNNIPISQHNNLPTTLSCPELESDPGVASAYLEYDGFTNVMTAMAQVQPCETYHIRLVISDVQDAYFDSAVFLKANSFSGGNTAQISVDIPEFGGDELTEDCTEGFFRFDRTNEDLTEDVVIRYSVSELSTATPGVDYEAFPDSIVIPAGAAFYNLPIFAYNDDLVEGTENILLEMEVPCSCENPFSVIYLKDGEPLETIDTEVFFCEGASGSLNANAMGGIGTLSYLWNTGDTSSELSVVTTETTDYSVTITDQCGKTVTATHRISITPKPTATLSGETFLCENITVNTLSVNLTGPGPWDLEYTLNGIPQNPVVGILNNDYQLPVTTPGNYVLTSVNSNACIGIPAGSGVVTAVNLEISETMDPSTCPDAADGALVVTGLGGMMPYSFSWENGIVGSTINNLDSGQYQVTLTDGNGCETVEDFSVLLDPEIPEVTISTAGKLTCDSTEINLSANASTGSIYDYLWQTDTGSIESGMNSLTPTITQPGVYTMEVINTNTGCRQSDTITVIQDITPPEVVVQVQGPQTLTCNETTTILDATASRPFGEVSFTWSTEDGYLDPANINNPIPEIDSAGLYQLFLTSNLNGCTATLNTLIDLNITVPNPIIGTLGELTCRDTAMQLDATASHVQGIPTFSWTTMDGIVVSGAAGPTPEISAPGTYQLVILDTENGCQNTETVVVNENREPPVAMISPVTEMLDCNTANLELTATGTLLDSYTFEWRTLNGNIIGNTIATEISVDAPGNYELLVTDMENGCQASTFELVEIDENKPENIAVAVQGPACFGETGSLSILGVTGGEGPYLYSLDIFDDEIFYSDTIYENLDPSDFTLTVLDINGCKHSQSVRINEVPALTVTTEPRYDIRLGETQELNARVSVPNFRIDSIIWQPNNEDICVNCFDPVVRPFEDTYYTVSVIDENGCTATAQTLVAVDKERRVFIPNAFSPNGDGQNEVVTVFTDMLSVVEVKTFQIFSRWGEKVFENNNFQPNQEIEGWNGLFGREKMMSGVYVYFAEVEFLDGHRELYEGDITLFR